MSDPVLFAFPGVKILQPDEKPGAASPGFLLLMAENVPAEWDPSRTDLFLRLQFTPDSPAAHPIDLLIEASNNLTKLDASTFQLSTSFGQLAIVFPPLVANIPLEDQRIDIPVEVRRGMTWEPIIREFENEIDRFVVYRKNEFSLAEGGGLATSASGSKGGYGYPDEKAGSRSGGEFGGRSISPDMTGIKPYDPRDYHGSPSEEGRLVLVDEENGSEVGEVGGMKVHADGVHVGSKDPVEVTVADDGQVNVREAYLADAMDPAYANSTIVGTAANVSRLIVTTSNYLGKALNSGANTFTQKTKPAEKPLTFQPSTHTRMEQLHNFSSSAAKLSSQTIGRATYFAQTAGAKLAGHKPRDPTVNAERGGRPAKPGILNKSMIAFGVVGDGLEHAGKTLLGHGQEAATKVVSHKYGPEAGQVARRATGSIKNVGLVYIDAAGVSRRAVIKGVAKGVVIGHVKGGGDVIVPASDGEKGEKLASPTTPGRMSPSSSRTPPPGPPPSYGSAMQQGEGGQMYFPPPPQEKGGNMNGEYRY